MNSFKKINKTIRKSGMNNSNEFLNSFLDKEDEIIQFLNNVSGTKSEIYLKEINPELADTLKFSALFSDITLINTTPSSINPYHISYHSSESKYFRERKITIPQEHINETGIDPKRFLPCYIYRNDSETKALFKNYSHLLKSDRLLIRPLRALYVSFPELRQGTLYYVDPNTSSDHWYVNKIQETEAITIDNGYLSYKNTSNLFEVTLPYFKNIDFDNLVKILEDENEILSSFRKNLREVIQKAGNNRTKIEEIKNDIALKSIEKLTRKFKEIQGKHRFIVGASLGSFVLTLSLGHIDIESILKSFAVSLTAMGISEYDLKIKTNDLKDDPYYLLWKISKKA
jgi:hypothetical protein